MSKMLGNVMSAHVQPIVTQKEFDDLAKKYASSLTYSAEMLRREQAAACLAMDRAFKDHHKERIEVHILCCTMLGYLQNLMDNDEASNFMAKRGTVITESGNQEKLDTVAPRSSAAVDPKASESEPQAPSTNAGPTKLLPRPAYLPEVFLLLAVGHICKCKICDPEYHAELVKQYWKDACEKAEADYRATITEQDKQAIRTKARRKYEAAITTETHEEIREEVKQKYYAEEREKVKEELRDEIKADFMAEEASKVSAQLESAWREHQANFLGSSNKGV